MISLDRIKIFLPIGILGFLVLVPVTATDNYIDNAEGDYGEIDKFSLSNVKDNSNRSKLRKLS